MGVRKRSSSSRFRVGKVSGYLHHGAWWLYYREDSKPVRRNVGLIQDDAERIAAQVNAQLAANTPTLLSFTAITIPELRRQFLDHHEQVLRSSLGTIGRYRAATRYFEDFATQQPRPPQAHQVRPTAFVSYLRRLEIAPNGHPNTAKRPLRDKGIRFILETCRSMYTFAVKRRHLPPYAGNPFAELPLERLKVEDAKPIFVFTADVELAFFKAATDWAFPIHFTLAKTGLRVGELVHLLIEDLDLHAGWLHVRNKAELGWRVKTGTERSVPLVAEVVSVLRSVIGKRATGPVFLRERLAAKRPLLTGDRRELAGILAERQKEARADGSLLSRSQLQKLARKVWSDAGVIKGDRVRTTFMRITAGIGQIGSTCPKSWRHSFATLLQDANVDPLIRQQTLGHKPTNGNGLGMTANYTHTRGETQREQIERALRRWPEALSYAAARVQA